MSPQQRTRSAECSHTHSTVTREAARGDARRATKGGRCHRSSARTARSAPTPTPLSHARPREEMPGE
eukprot:4507131-Prymnesium_polylepis.1